MDINNGGKSFNFIKLNPQTNNVNVNKPETVDKQQNLSLIDIKHEIKKTIEKEVKNAPEELETLDVDVAKVTKELKEQSLLKYSKEEDIKGFLVKLYNPEKGINLVG